MSGRTSTTSTGRRRAGASARSCTACRTPPLGSYHGEERTAAAFSHGWFHGGDLGVIDEHGYLSIVDRKEDMIETGGESVASREVEEALYQLDAVAQPHWIGAVTAVVLPEEGAAVTPERVGAHAREVPAAYERPKYVIIADALPRARAGRSSRKTRVPATPISPTRAGPGPVRGRGR